MARLGDWLPLLLMLGETLKHRRAKKLVGALPLVHSIRSRFRLAYLNGASFELSAAEVQEVGAHLKLD